MNLFLKQEEQMGLEHDILWREKRGTQYITARCASGPICAMRLTHTRDGALRRFSWNVLTSALCLQNNLQVDLAISSKEFAFERARARAFPSDWDSMANLSRGDPVLLFEATELIDSRIISASVSEPGEFVLLLSELTVRRFHDNRRFDVPWFSAQFNLTDPDVQEGSATVIVNPTGLFRVSIFDRAQQPLHGRQLVLYCDRMTIQLVTDENGGVFLLDNPTRLRVDAGTARIAIEPL